ncbi:hypothetical protein [Streptomyces sp. NBC_00038]|uniref:hypothetical protein n=1 Tax=Streptomyces sp. NBC_00038 TaxID=2903615 RepID=UPI002251269D|nr:hypothetical protein [Streptomyces sp. NBC_00038]MCX5562736.1 hypothetical protein [Streptomyces sp. NBC_00038]MCX5563614.1 hypothetical protein [Streptomyces sp. NBC_00038]
MTEHTADQDDQEPRVRRPFGYRPRLVPNGKGRALGELLTMYADGEVDLEEIARIMNSADAAAPTAKDLTLNVLDTLRTDGDLDAETYDRLRGAVERAGAEQHDEAGTYVMSTRDRTDEPVVEGGFVDDFTSPKAD